MLKNQNVFSFFSSFELIKIIQLTPGTECFSLAHSSGLNSLPKSQSFFCPGQEGFIHILLDYIERRASPVVWNRSLSTLGLNKQMCWMTKVLNMIHRALAMRKCLSHSRNYFSGRLGQRETETSRHWRFRYVVEHSGVLSQEQSIIPANAGSVGPGYTRPFYSCKPTLSLLDYLIAQKP